MTPRLRRILCFFSQATALSFFFSPSLPRALALNEVFDLYNSPQGLAMGNAFTADATGHASQYYNPAGLAKASRKDWDFTPIAVEGILGLGGIAQAVSGHTLGVYRLFQQMQAHPGRYTYFRFNTIPSYTRRGLGVSLLGSYQYAALSDGTHLDINSSVDVAPTVSAAMNFAGNLIKLGVSGRVILRNQLQGNYLHSALEDENTVRALQKEGIAYGADVGMLITLPQKYLPTLGVAWKDIGDTAFHATHLLTNTATGAPEPIRTSVNAAISVHPRLNRTWRLTVAAEFKHIERGDLDWKKRAHFGIQIEDEKNLFFWFGLNQLHITAGLGWHVSGGHLEVGTYGQDIGATSTPEEDRRVFFRYTIGF